MRIGHGYDVHRFAQATGEFTIRLGGVDVPCSHEVIAHSDGDVVIHAVCDALLGALSLGDIGQHFPDTDAAYSNVDSGDLLQHVCGLVQTNGYVLGNADITVIAQMPKVAPYRTAMVERLAQLMNVQASQLSVKATTTEKLGYLGRGEGIAAESVVLLVKV